jgi:hypothetical protein
MQLSLRAPRNDGYSGFRGHVCKLTTVRARGLTMQKLRFTRPKANGRNPKVAAVSRHPTRGLINRRRRSS